MRTASTVGRYGTIGAQILAVIVGCAILMGQGCPASVPSGDTGGTDTGVVQGQFVGAADCKLCHSRVFDTWSTTQHSRALETLKAIGQDKNPACLPCHTVGFGQEGGFVDEVTTPTLAGVQCESCHEAGLTHRSNAADPTARPLKSIAANVCGKCHNDAHHPTFDEWSNSGHAKVSSSAATYFTQGKNLNACGVCHSGDFRVAAFVEGDTVPDTFLAGKPAEAMNAVTCAVCHDPHRPTGNNPALLTGNDENPEFPSSPEDYQLRYPEVATPTQANTIADTTNPARFNLCGQCHHTRDKVWTATDRGPHHSVQANVYLGEMPVPEGTPLLVPNTRTVHRFVPKQCVTCHMKTKEFESEEEIAESGHGFAVKLAGCSSVGCHPTPESAEADMVALQANVKTQLDAIVTRMGARNTWDYSAEGGAPASAQAAIPDQIKKVRFMYHYIEVDGSMGVHNPEYVKAMLKEMDIILKSINK